MKLIKPLLFSTLLLTLTGSFARALPPVNVGPILRAGAEKATQAGVSSFTDAISSATLHTMAEAFPDLLSLSNADAAREIAKERVDLWQDLGLIEDSAFLPEIAVAALEEDLISEAKFNAVENARARPYQNRFDAIPHGMDLHPIYGYKEGTNTLRAQDLYPEEVRQGLLKSEKDFLDFFIKKQNLFYSYVVSHHTPVLRRNISAHLQEIQQEAQALANFHPENPFIWAAQQVPAGTNTIIFSETHQKWVPLNMIPMIDVLLENNPGKEFFYLTEFISKDHILKFTEEFDLLEQSDWDYSAWYPLWKALEERNIPIIGLEADFVGGSIKDDNLETTCEFLSQDSVWESLEGMRIRNQHWLEVYNRIRAEHPDAIIIIHTGSAHASYLMPFSISREILGKVFNIQFANADQMYLLDSLVSPIQLPPYLKWSKPQLGPITGFDVRIQWKDPQEE